MSDRAEQSARDPRGLDVVRWQQGWRFVAVFGRLRAGKGGWRGVRGCRWGAAQAI